MSIEDQFAIHEGIARYSYAYDSKDADGFAQLFIEDGIFEVMLPGADMPIVRLSSRAAIRDWATRRHQLNVANQARHYQSGVLFDELTIDTASVRTMLLLTRQGAVESTPVLVLTGVYHDTWCKTADGWRLRRRTACVDRDPGFQRHWA